MGWTYTHRAKGVRHHDWFQKNVMGEGEENPRILDASASRNVVYAATLIRPKDRDPYVSAAVILCQWVPNDPRGFNFGYKVLDETVAPGEARCPERILDLLSPVEDFAEPGTPSYESAVEWRRECRAYHERRRNRTKVQKGDVIEFREGFHYGKAGTICRFEIADLRRNLGRIPGDPTMLYRLHPDWRDLEFTVISRAADRKRRAVGV